MSWPICYGDSIIFTSIFYQLAGALGFAFVTLFPYFGQRKSSSSKFEIAVPA